MDLNPVSILYVDDEEILLDLAKTFLERMDAFSVRKASSASEALSLLESSPYDVIVSDYQMPETDGIEFLKRVRANYPEVPFILFTGRGREEVVIQAINNGATFYIQKGGDPTAQFMELAHKIRQAVSRVRAERELSRNSLALRQQERVIKEGETFYRTVFENTGTAMMVIEEDLTISLVNAECERLIGYRNGEIKGEKQWMGFISAEDRKKILSWHRTRCKNGRNTPLCREFTIVSRSGERRRVYATLAFIPGTRTSVASLVDITERVLMKDALKHAETLHRTIFEISPDPIAITDLEGNLVRASLSALELFGLESEDEAIGKPLFNWIAPEVRDQLRERILAFIRVSPAPASSLLYPLIRKDGTRFYAEISSSVLRGSGGKPEGMISVLRDATDRIAAEAAIKNARAKLELLATMTQDDILSRLSTLIRTIEVAHQESGGARTRKCLDETATLAKAVRIQVQFLKNCQALAMNVPCWQGLTGVIRTLLPEIGSGHVVISDKTGNLEVFADPLVGKAFFDLLDNALRFGKTTTKITIRHSREGPDLQILIEDDGQGVPNEKKAKIFEQGYRREAGCGLFLAREILGITGMIITEEGIYGAGARFVIRVPAGQFRFREEAAEKGSVQYPVRETGASGQGT